MIPGDELGQLLFLVAVAMAGIPTQPLSLPMPPPVSGEEFRLKFVDDYSMGEVVELKEKLRPKPELIGS